ncbi:MAG: hypothetical protein EOM10_15925, partial [Opitutae bacterium]|nr:hypothetical protein [Opitutae bacterium]
MRLEGAGRNPAPQLSGEGRLAGVSHYYRGTDPAEWRHGLPHYARVHYAQVYPGIDLVYYGRPGALEYDFEVAAGADPGQIRLSFAGVDGIRVEEANGDLILAVEGMELRHRAPRLYQQVGGERRTVAGRYRLRAADGDAVAGLQVGFEVADYDPTLALVIDPVVVYSTYLGGSGSDGASDVAVDAAGNVYVAGYTDSVDFPTVSALRPTNAGSWDAFVTKLDPSGRGVVYST